MDDCVICHQKTCAHMDLPDEEFERQLSMKMAKEWDERHEAQRGITWSDAFLFEPSYVWAPYVSVYKSPQIDLKEYSKSAMKKYKSTKKVDYISEFKWELEYAATPKKKLPKYSFEDLQKLFKVLAGVGMYDIDLGDLTEEEIDEYIKNCLDDMSDKYNNHSNASGSPGPTAPPVPMAPTKEELRAQRKRDGVCLECGDRGEFVNGACICKNGHGKIFG